MIAELPSSSNRLCERDSTGGGRVQTLSSPDGTISHSGHAVAGYKAGVYNPIIYPPLSVLCSEDEDIFGATILIFLSNHRFCEILHRQIWEILISPRIQCILWTALMGITEVAFQANLQRRTEIGSDR